MLANTFAEKDTFLQVTSKITSVTVFLEGAQINRKAKVNLEAGNYWITLKSWGIRHKF